MKRRGFITLLGGAAAWPLMARAQPQTMPVIGYLTGGALQVHLFAAFQRGLAETGYIDGRNLRIEQSKEVPDRYDQLPALVAKLIDSHVALIVAGGAAAAGLAAKSATTTIPIVFVCGEDPVKSGLVDSLSRPGGNLTGFSFFTSPLEQKRMELLHELLPKATRIGVLVNPTFRDAEAQVKDAQAAAQAFGQQIIVTNASRDSDIAEAFQRLIERRADALLVGSDPFLFRLREQIVATATQRALPVVYNERRYVEAGGLLSYGTDVAEIFRQAGVYTGRILGGTKPADLPVVLPSKFEMLINLKAAKLLGLDVPTSILLRADEVIE